jgi:hypothetical protein
VVKNITSNFLFLRGKKKDGRSHELRLLLKPLLSLDELDLIDPTAVDSEIAHLGMLSAGNL